MSAPTDATIPIAHSDKQLAAGTFKGSWGHHSLTVWCDNTSESVAFRLRPGNAGSNTAGDHIGALREAFTQLPGHQPGTRPGKSVLVPPDWIEELSWAKSSVRVNVDRESIRHAPAFDPAAPVNREYEVRLYDYYGRPRYWP